MAEQEEKSASIPWLPLITLIGLGTGVLFLHFQQLTSSRPGGGDPRLANETFDDQTVDARLWQDPLGVAVADREKKTNEPHSIGLFQELLIEKCFALSQVNPSTSQSSFFDNDQQAKISAERLEILAVMIPGGPYVEDVERRLRSRRAVIEALGISHYDPEKNHELGYFYVPWPSLRSDTKTCVSLLERNRSTDQRSRTIETEPVLVTTSGSELGRKQSGTQEREFLRNAWIRPARHENVGIHPQSEQSDQEVNANPQQPEAHALMVPYEWCQSMASEAKTNRSARILVLWLRDDAFEDAPLARLADLISWIRLKVRDGNFILPSVAVLGPDNSGTLHSMVSEADLNPWNDDTRDCLQQHIFIHVSRRRLSLNCWRHTAKASFVTAPIS